VAIAIHNYRWRLGLAKGEPKYDELEQKLFARPTIAVPTITIASDFDGPLADGKAYASMFSRRISHRILKGIGHNVPQEAPKAFAQAVIDVAHAST
jgi:pimeloyl-ACP methyl ester carboxylesterase